MSESHSNRTDQMGMAILAVVLFGLLFMGVGASGWFYLRAERARRVEQVLRMEQARYEAEAQCQRAEAVLADRNVTNEQAEESMTQSALTRGEND
jgi:hypothetical protein